MVVSAFLDDYITGRGTLQTGEIPMLDIFAGLQLFGVQVELSQFVEGQLSQEELGVGFSVTKVGEGEFCVSFSDLVFAHDLSVLAEGMAFILSHFKLQL